MNGCETDKTNKQLGADQCLPNTIGSTCFNRGPSRLRRGRVSVRFVSTLASAESGRNESRRSPYSIRSFAQTAPGA
jgi:hypothetical protein